MKKHKSWLTATSDSGFYTSLMTDHDTNRRNGCYCTDTLFGTVGAVNEALLFSNTGKSSSSGIAFRMEIGVDKRTDGKDPGGG